MAESLTPTAMTEDLERRRVAAAGYHFDAGDTSSARTLLEEVIESALHGRVRAEALRRLGTIRYFDDAETAVDILTRALDETEGEADLEIAIARDLAWLGMLRGELRAAARYARRALDAALRLGDRELLAQALTAESFTRFLSGRRDFLDPLERAVELGGWSAGMRLFPHPNLMFGILLKWTCRYEAAREKFLEMQRYSADRGEESSLAFLLYHMSELECFTGNMPEALEYAGQSVDLAVHTGQQATLSVSLYSLALVLAQRGELDEARARAEEGLRLARATPGSRVRALQNLGVLGFIELSDRRAEEAWSCYEQIEDFERDSGWRELGLIRWHPDAVEALISLGRLDRAKGILDELEGRAEDLAHPWGRSSAARCRGLLAGAEGDIGAAVTELDAAVSLARPLGQPFELGRSLLALGTAQRRSDQTQQARASLREARELFDRLGNDLWRDRAEDELERTGPRATRRGALTPTEARVAELVVTGKSNRDVGKELFISEKTVEVNLTRIYAKLGVHSRTELAARLAAEARTNR